MRKTIRIFALGLALLLLTACGAAQPPSVSGLPGPGTEGVSASAAPRRAMSMRRSSCPRT